MLVLCELDVGFRTLALPMQPLYMHWQIIRSHNLAMDIWKMLTFSKISIQIAVQWDTSSEFTIWQLISSVPPEPSRCLHSNSSSVCSIARDTTYWSQSLTVQHTSIASSVTNLSLPWACVTLCVCVTVVAWNLASFNYFLGKMYLVAFVIFWGQYQESA